MFSNWQYRILAVILALLCWYLVTGREKVETWLEIPVELADMPQDLRIRDGLKTRIDVRVRGSKSMIRGLDPKQLGYLLDLSGLSQGENIITFDPKNIPLSGPLEVTEIKPPRMTLHVDGLMEKKMPVNPVWKGRLDADYRLVDASAMPFRVALSGPESVLEKMKNVSTLAVQVNSTTPETFSSMVGLSLPQDVEARPDKVEVKLVFEVKKKKVWVKIPVKAVPEKVKNVSIRPKVVQLHVETPVTLLRKRDFKKTISVVVVLPTSLKPGKHVLPYRVKLPEECLLLKAVPEQVDVTLKNG